MRLRIDATVIFTRFLEAAARCRDRFAQRFDPTNRMNPAKSVAGRVSKRRSRWQRFAITTCLIAFFAGAHAAGIEYVYDAVGQLVGVITPLGTSASYGYDVTGNIISISNNATSPVWIGSFSPPAAAVGGAVTISGRGFDTTAANNTVSFNGAVGTVGASTATTIDVTVPVGATTGKVTVSNSNGSAVIPP